MKCGLHENFILVRHHSYLVSGLDPLKITSTVYVFFFLLELADSEDQTLKSPTVDLDFKFKQCNYIHACIARDNTLFSIIEGFTLKSRVELVGLVININWIILGLQNGIVCEEKST